MFCALHAWWSIDPLPVSSHVYGSTAWWRWWSAEVLKRRKEQA